MHRSAPRRGRLRTTVVATALAVSGVLGTAGAATAAPPPAPEPRLVPHLTLAHLATIPDAALLQARDLRGSAPEPAAEGAWDALRPPQPCTDRPYPSRVLLRSDRAVQAMVGFHERPTVVMEHVAVYRLGGAHLYLRDLGRALAACPTPGEHEPRWTVRATGLAGDESMLLELREWVDYAESYKSTYVFVARTGRALVVVADAGWEDTGGHESLVRELAPRAVARAAVLNR